MELYEKGYIMKIKGDPNGFPNRLWKFFVSVRLTVLLLLVLAVSSIIGTLIPQNASPEAYVNHYGTVFYTIFDMLDIFDMYHSWWFRFLLLLLAVNIIACSANRFLGVWKIVFSKEPKFNISRFKALSDKEEFQSGSSPKELEKIYTRTITKRFGYTKIKNTGAGFLIFAEKWRWTRLGVYIVHFSVILLLAGGLIGSIFGFEGYVNIPEGETKNTIRLRKTGKPQHLKFDIRCDYFKVNFYDTGAPKEYRSGLTLINDGKPIFAKAIVVNDPLRYAGVNIFQSSYGAIMPNDIVLKITSNKTGMLYERKAVVGTTIDLPENMGTFVLKKFVNSYNFMGHTVGEAFIGTLIKNNEDRINIVLPLQFSGFDKMRKGECVISAADYKKRYYTGLQVTHDPGVVVVYSGFIMIIFGCFVTFFMSHQVLCVEVVRKEGKTNIMVAGSANKNRIGMRNQVKKLALNLQKKTAKDCG